MAIGTPVEVVPAESPNTSDSIVKTLGSGEAIAGGLAIYVQINVRSNGQATGASVVDDSSNTYTQVAEEISSNQEHIWLFRCTDCTALADSDTITASWSGNTLSSSLQIMSVSGIATAPGDQVDTNAGSGSVIASSGPITPTAGERLVIGGMMHRRADRTVTQDSDFTNLTDTNVLAQNDQSRSHQGYWGYIVDTWDGLTSQDRVDTGNASLNFAAYIVSEQASAVVPPSPGDNIAAQAAERKKVARLLRM